MGKKSNPNNAFKVKPKPQAVIETQENMKTSDLVSDNLPPKVIGEYIVGDQSDNGDVIGHIYGKSEELIVFQCKNGLIKWEYDGDDSTRYSNATNAYESLRVSIPYELPENVKHSVINQLALALYNALSGSDLKQAFKGVEKRISQLLTPNQAKLRLILYSLLCTLLLGLCFLYIYSQWASTHKVVFATGGAGLLGSLYSLLQRNSKVKIPQDNGDFYIFLQALFVCMLGALSGLIIYIFSKSQLPISFVNGNLYSMLIFSILAGFSERMVPDLFDGINTKKHKT